MTPIWRLFSPPQIKKAIDKWYEHKNFPIRIEAVLIFSFTLDPGITNDEILSNRFDETLLCNG